MSDLIGGLIGLALLCAAAYAFPAAALVVFNVFLGMIFLSFIIFPIVFLLTGGR